MTKFYGDVGFSITSETSPGVWEPEEVSFPYYGDVISNTRRWRSEEKINDDILVTNKISILSDDFIRENLGFIKWVEFMGCKWKIDSIDIAYPRIVLTLGGVYNA